MTRRQFRSRALGEIQATGDTGRVASRRIGPIWDQFVRPRSEPDPRSAAAQFGSTAMT